MACALAKEMNKWPVRLGVRTRPFHGRNTGSIPVRATDKRRIPPILVGFLLVDLFLAYILNHVSMAYKYENELNLIKQLQKMQEYASLINHMHYKDWNGEPEFTLMGNGKVDLLGITQWLKDREYKGWIICEDEGAEALEDPDFVTLHDGRWINETLIKGLR